MSSLTGGMLALVAMAAGSIAPCRRLQVAMCFFHSVRGAARIGSGEVTEHHLAQFGDGKGVKVSSVPGCLILYGHAEPIGELVVAHGPFVMNTREEILQALQDYQRGVFGDPAGLG